MLQTTIAKTALSILMLSSAPKSFASETGPKAITRVTTTIHPTILFAHALGNTLPDDEQKMTDRMCFKEMLEIIQRDTAAVSNPQAKNFVTQATALLTQHMETYDQDNILIPQGELDAVLAGITVEEKLLFCFNYQLKSYNTVPAEWPKRSRMSTKYNALIHLGGLIIVAANSQQ